MKKAFTLVELVIAMSIIAVLIAIAAYGIAIVQRNSRNSQRSEFANQFKLGVETFYTNFARYPKIEDGEICETMDRRIVFRTSARVVHEFNYRNMILVPMPSTTKTQTAYCYSQSGTGLYSIQFQSETGATPSTKWSSNLGTWATQCEGGTPIDLDLC